MRHTTHRRTWRLAAALAALSVTALAACGNGPKVESANDVALPKTPSRIVSLSPTATESLFAIGAGGQVKAADSLSNYPPVAPDTALSAFNLSIEAVAKYKPDLVIISSDTTPGKNALAGFAKLKIPVLVQPAAKTLEEVDNQILELGKVTGRVKDAVTLVAKMRKEIGEAIQTANPGAGIKIFHEVDATLYSATSDTFIGRVYKDFGLTNIADAAAAADAQGYPQLTSEYVVKANPMVIFLADTAYGETFDNVAVRPGWDQIDAVKMRFVVPLDSDIASRWGPRVVELYKAVGKAIPALK
ncbi:MAG: ABC transporter substrate-binding protein [Actinomycetales bacterium]|nr:ABC transporter substrate-binding protein [Actinomycetales bacterium]